MPLRDTAGRPKAVFLLLACCTQEKMRPRQQDISTLLKGDIITLLPQADPQCVKAK
jgi:hypothetical protein